MPTRILQNPKKQNAKPTAKRPHGFTLVELIVVLVILAILAALLVPALTGYIDRAQRQSTIAAARQAYLAAQTITSEKYGLGAYKSDTGILGQTDNASMQDNKAKDYTIVFGETRAGSQSYFSSGREMTALATGNIDGAFLCMVHYVYGVGRTMDGLLFQQGDYVAFMNLGVVANLGIEDDFPEDNWYVLKVGEHGMPNLPRRTGDLYITQGQFKQYVRYFVDAY